MSKKNRKETLRSTILDKVDTEESIIPDEEFKSTVLDPEDILLNLLCIRKFKRELEQWVESTNYLIQDKDEMMSFKPDVTIFIELYLEDLRKFSVSINDIVEKVNELIASK